MFCIGDADSAVGSHRLDVPPYGARQGPRKPVLQKGGCNTEGVAAGWVEAHLAASSGDPESTGQEAAACFRLCLSWPVAVQISLELSVVSRAARIKLSLKAECSEPELLQSPSLCVFASGVTTSRPVRGVAKAAPRVEAGWWVGLEGRGQRCFLRSASYRPQTLLRLIRLLLHDAGPDPIGAALCLHAGVLKGSWAMAYLQACRGSCLICKINVLCCEMSGPVNHKFAKS